MGLFFWRRKKEEELRATIREGIQAGLAPYRELTCEHLGEQPRKETTASRLKRKALEAVELAREGREKTLREEIFPAVISHIEEKADKGWLWAELKEGATYSEKKIRREDFILLRQLLRDEGFKVSIKNPTDHSPYIYVRWNHDR